MGDSSSIILPAAITAGVGLAGYALYKKYGGQIAAPKPMTPAEQLAAYEAALRGQGPSLQGAAVSGATNKDGKEAIEETFKTAREYMGAWRPQGRGAQRSIQVVKPKDKASQWSIPEGCWFPGEDGAQSFRQGPIEAVRGFDLGFAVTYWPDVYGTTANSAGLVIGYVGTPFEVKRLTGFARTALPFPVWGLVDNINVRDLNDLASLSVRNPSVTNQREVDLFITSSAQGSQLYAWDPQAKVWLPGNAFNLCVRVNGSLSKSVDNAYEKTTFRALSRVKLATSKVW